MNNLPKEIQDTRLVLDDINEKKEFWFTRKEDLKKVINNLIIEIKGIKIERDKRNIELQELKKQRDMYNKEVQVLIDKIKKSNKEKSKTFKRYNIKIDPKKIQEKINQIEQKIEIETSFEKEKKLMEEIKKLKKSYVESAELFKASEESDALAVEIKETRRKADEFHKKIQEIAKDANYDTFLKISNKITETKKIQESAFQKFIDYKNEYAKASQELKFKLDALEAIKSTENKKKAEKNIHLKEKQNKILEERTKRVEEKLKSEKKLTTEDLWVFQTKDMA